LIKMRNDPRIDTYIAEAAPFARPILRHLRSVVHRVCPEAEEAIKWHMPMFSLQGKLFCALGAFKAHCRFMIFGPEVRALITADGHGGPEADGSFGKLTSLADLPNDRQIAKYLKFAAERVAEGKSPMSRGPRRAPKPAPKVPPAFAAALRRHPAAETTFAGLSPSCRREYLEWIMGAKQEETKARRMAQAILWLADGKKLNWKYER
jgi:uncharacterized protein YdeI (YjbR/CyaY-like superfamily)